MVFEDVFDNNNNNDNNNNLFDIDVTITAIYKQGHKHINRVTIYEQGN